MKLFYRKIGEGQPMIIIHGLFGQSDNWNWFGKQFAEKGFEVYLVDARNHGLSPHSDVWNYQVMSDDIMELINTLDLCKNEGVVLLGHSMGGKIAMEFALQHADFLSKLIIVDIAPKFYPPHHQDVLNGLNAVDLYTIKTRNEAESALSKYISDTGTKQFLLKNLYWKENVEEALVTGHFEWRFNLKVIEKNIDTISQEILSDSHCTTPTLFIKGERSNYIKEEDEQAIQKIFPNSTMHAITDAGHWVHVEKPKEFLETVLEFLK
jgi:pimeloyl-ACP methyl ester carboxylesterase